MKKLPRSFYERKTILVAKDLFGCHLVHRSQGVEKVGKIVEVEAYLGSHDLACHSSKGVTPRTATMFGPAGHAYVYLIYGMYHCFNVVTEPQGTGAAVLIRALEHISNILHFTHGPGLLSKAMMIDKTLNGVDLLSDFLFITDKKHEKPIKIVATPRIGVPYAKEWAHKPLRFYIEGNPFVSKSRALGR